MSKRGEIVLATMAAVLMMSTSTMAQSSCESLGSVTEDFSDALIKCIDELQSENASLRGELEDLKRPDQLAKSLVPAVAEELVSKHAGELPAGKDGKDGINGANGSNGKDGRDATAPKGIVVTSTRRCNDLGTGWQEYTEGQGRFILGVGQGPLSAFVGADTTGGQENVVLTPAQMPSHTHVLSYVPEVSNLSGGSYAVMSDTRHPSQASVRRTEPTSPAGSGAPHPNMPPYVALYFCKKT